MCRRFHILLTSLLLASLLYGQKNVVPIQPGSFYLKIRQETIAGDPKSARDFFSFALLEKGKFFQAKEPVRKPQASQRLTSSVLDGLYKISVDNDTNLDSLIFALSQFPNVQYAEPVYQERLFYTPNDPQFSSGNQGYLEVIRAISGWDISKSSNEIVVGIADSGLDFDHEDIRNKLYLNQLDPPNGLDDDDNGYIDDYRGYDFADNDSIAQCELSYHGNRVGGIAGAETDNETGIAGVGFDVLLCPLKIFRSADNMSNNAYESVLYAADNGMDILNLSWGSENSYSQAAQDIINYAVLEKDVVVIAAAGNTPSDLKFYPASYENVLSVSATDLEDVKASFATFNYAVDLVAPGADILSTFKDNAYATDNGTSYSAPMVSGAAALLKSRFPDLSAVQVMELLRVSTDPIYGLANNINYLEKLGSGRLNIQRALSGESLKSVRVSDFSYGNSYGSHAFYGDTIWLALRVNNWLSPLENGTLRFSASPDFVTFQTSELPLGQLNTDDSIIINQNFLVLSENTPPDTAIPIRVGIEDEEYGDFQYLEITTDPNHIDFGNQEFALTIAGNGNLGYEKEDLKGGIGITWDTKKILTRAGFLTGTSAEKISDNLPYYSNSSSRQQDFTAGQYIRYIPSDIAGITIHSTFQDDSASTPLGLVIDQKAFAFDDRNFIILEYRLVNNSPDTLKALKAGLFLDWDLNIAYQNRSYFDPVRSTLIAHDKEETVFSGTQVFQDDTPIYQALDLQAISGNIADLSEELELTDSVKHSLASTWEFDSAGFEGAGNDIANLLSCDSITILPGKSKKATFFLAAAGTLNDLHKTLADADSAYRLIQTVPPLAEVYTSCEGASLEIDPQSGDQFRFFSDPLGTDLIAEGDSLKTGAITSDTVFYLQSIDGSYEGEIKRLEIRQVPKVADFTMSTDTLYLDHTTLNVVAFVDHSFRPIAWNWDFGNGTRSTIQDPKVIFSQPGHYEITLSVKNELGCAGINLEKLIVAARPDSPEIADKAVCTGQAFDLYTPTEDSLALYLLTDPVHPLVISDVIHFNGFHQDTCFLVSRLEGAFESLQVTFCVKIDEVYSDFSFQADTLSSKSMVRFTDTGSNSVTRRWYVDGVFAGNEKSINLTVESNSYAIALAKESDLGCYDSLSRMITFVTSPLPSIDPPKPCPGQPAVITPGNGRSFGFYADQDLDSLIKKGSTLQIDSVIRPVTVFVVGLDSILPSDPVEVLIEPDVFDPGIHVDPDTLILSMANTATFFTSQSDILSYEWSVNGGNFESVPAPVFFFDTAGIYEVALSALSSSLCSGSDTLQYHVLDYPPGPVPLSNTYDEPPSIYPNPSDGGFLLQNLPKTCNITVTNMAGTEIYSRSCATNTLVIDLSAYPDGIYLLTISSKENISQKKLYKN